MRVLIIDDEQYVRLVLEQTLRDEGCNVVVASDGKAGIAALEGEPFDCVITDLRMPGIDGLSVLKWVADHQPGPEVVMLTGQGDVKDAGRNLRIRVSHHSSRRANASLSRMVIRSGTRGDISPLDSASLR
jgi:DNA-binding NtrC family response regulator